MKGIKLEPGFKVINGKVVADTKAQEARLPVNKRIARKKSKRVRVQKSAPRQER